MKETEDVPSTPAIKKRKRRRIYQPVNETAPISEKVPSTETDQAQAQDQSRDQAPICTNNTAKTSIVSEHTMPHEEAVQNESLSTLTPQQRQANVVVSKYVKINCGIGFVPFPILDFFAFSATQTKMVSELCAIYNVKFSEQRGKALIFAIIGSSQPGWLRGFVLSSLSKFIPGIAFASMVVMPITAGAITYATGKVFIKHFELGGTFLDFDPKSTKVHFRKAFANGKQIVAKVDTEAIDCTC